MYTAMSGTNTRLTSVYDRRNIPSAYFDSDADNEDYNRRYPKYITQRVTGQVSGFLYGKVRLDML